MKLIDVNPEVKIKLTEDELLIINASLNEVCNGIDVFEFETRIGASREKIENMIIEVQAILSEIGGAS